MIILACSDGRIKWTYFKQGLALAIKNTAT